MTNSLDAMLALATATRWSWRDPYPNEDVPDANGFRPLVVRNENVRAVCLAFEYDPKWKLCWSIWQAQRRDEGGEWQETFRFPRMEEIRQDETGCWRRRDFCVREDSPEWKHLCPFALRTLISVAPNEAE